MVCERGMLDLIPEQTPSDFGRDVLPLALRRGIPVYGEPLAPDEFLIDIGTPESYERARMLARAQDEADSSLAALRR
jgi:NDP-sugar pyrophosphorylase family protein